VSGDGRQTCRWSGRRPPQPSNEAARRYHPLRPLVENQLEHVAGEYEHALHLLGVQCRTPEIMGVEIDDDVVHVRARQQRKGIRRGNTDAAEVGEERKDNKTHVFNVLKGSLVVCRCVSHGHHLTAPSRAATGTRNPRHDDAAAKGDALATASVRSPCRGRRCLKAAKNTRK